MYVIYKLIMFRCDIQSKDTYNITSKILVGKLWERAFKLFLFEGMFHDFFHYVSMECIGYIPHVVSITLSSFWIFGRKIEAHAIK